MKVEILQQNGYDFLWIDGELVMWDIPIERKCQKELADKASGAVLVAGYGLGLVQKYLLDNHNVTSITTVEKHSEIFIECERVGIRIIGDYMFADFFRLNTDTKYDCVIGDVWSDILPEGLKDYKKFKKKAQELIVPGGEIFAWGQDYFEYLINKKK